MRITPEDVAEINKIQPYLPENLDDCAEYYRADGFPIYAVTEIGKVPLANPIQTIPVYLYREIHLDLMKERQRSRRHIQSQARLITALVFMLAAAVGLAIALGSVAIGGGH
jgi:hypothetical protein